MTTLAEFAKAHPTQRGRWCWCRDIPEREEIEAAYASGIGAKTIIRWLHEEKDYDPKEATYGRVHNHLSNHPNGCPT